MCDTITLEKMPSAMRGATPVALPVLGSSTAVSLQTRVSPLAGALAIAPRIALGDPHPRNPPTCTTMPSLARAAASAAPIMGFSTIAHPSGIASFLTMNVATSSA